MKWFVGLIVTQVLVFVTFLVMAIATTAQGSGSGTYSHALLEADRRMTEQMAVQTSMAETGMIERSADPSYLGALEEHVRQFDRMLALTP
ncbi:MAG TPA: hypothetical protein VJN50_08895 [Actinomycetota bacterium]|nr:hypothetical protein [Actinomycetota bacterium]